MDSIVGFVSEAKSMRERILKCMCTQLCRGYRARETRSRLAAEKKFGKERAAGQRFKVKK